MRTKIIKILFLLMVSLFLAYAYREISSGRSDTEYKLDNYFVYYQKSGEIIYIKNDKKIKIQTLLGGNYDQLCVVTRRDSFKKIEHLIGRELQLWERVYLLWMRNTGGDSVFGSQFLFEKGNRITKVEAVMKPITFLNKYPSSVTGCIDYTNSIIRSDYKSGTLYVEHQN